MVRIETEKGQHKGIMNTTEKNHLVSALEIFFAIEPIDEHPFNNMLTAIDQHCPEMIPDHHVDRLADLKSDMEVRVEMGPNAKPVVVKGPPEFDSPEYNEDEDSESPASSCCGGNGSSG